MTPTQITKAELEQRLFAIPDNYTINNVYTILDGASINDLPATLKTFNANFVCLYRGELDQEMQQVAPYLVALQQNTDLFHWVFSGIGHHWGIFIVTTADFPTLRKHFRRFLMIYDTEKNPSTSATMIRAYCEIFCQSVTRNKKTPCLAQYWITM